MSVIDMKPDDIREAVRDRYGEIASNEKDCGCGPDCCTPGEAGAESHADEASRNLGYSEDELAAAPEGANLGLGCGNPQAIAALRPGETVLDLGSGGGFDVFLAARAVGPEGLAIGVDMTPAMISRARSNAEKAGTTNAEFRLGEIEHLPVPDGTVDAVISNCVINLSPEKPQVYREAFRVLKSGGRLAVSDVVATAEMPASALADLASYTGCVSGAALITELREMLAGVGFEEIEIRPADGSKEFVDSWISGGEAADYVASATIEARKPAAG